jgi:hypothetical protein
MVLEEDRRVKLLFCGVYQGQIFQVGTGAAQGPTGMQRAVAAVMRNGPRRATTTSGTGASPEHRKLLHAIAKAGGDRERAIKNVYRLYGVKSFDALPAHIQNAVRELIPPS